MTTGDSTTTDTPGTAKAATPANELGPAAAGPGLATTHHTLAVKLCEVMALVDQVPKRGRNDFHGYSYATESDITAAVRSALAERHVLMLPRIEGIEWGETPRRNGGVDRLCTTRVRFEFIDGDTGEVLPVLMLGQGSDAGDKAFYKAITGALKYALLKTFLISTGNDDPENEQAPTSPVRPGPSGAQKGQGPTSRATKAHSAPTSHAATRPRGAGPPETPENERRSGVRFARPGEPGGPHRNAENERQTDPAAVATPAHDGPEARQRFLALLESAKTGPEVAAAGKFATEHLSKTTRDELRVTFNAALARVTGKGKTEGQP